MAFLMGIVYMYITIYCKKDNEVHLNLHDIPNILDGLLWDI